MLEKPDCSKERIGLSIAKRVIVSRSLREQLFVGNRMRRYSLEEWHDLGRAFFEPRPKTVPQEFSAEAEFCGADRLILTKVRFTPQLLAREPIKFKEFDSEYLLFERYLSGEGCGVLNGNATRVNSGTLHLVDMSQHYTTSTTQVVANGVLIPYDVVGFDPSRNAHYVSVSRSRPRARLLEAAFDALDAAVAYGDHEEVRDLADAFVGLVQRFLLGCEEDTNLQTAGSTLDLALRAHINEHLQDPDLGAEDLCDRFGLSRASLYRRFREDGGVEHYITGLRLDRCLAELCAARPIRGNVKIIAHRWGFTDPGNFNRRFRERFDIVPTECLALNTRPRTKSAVGGKHHLVHQWMRRRRR